MKILQLSVHFSPNVGGVETHLMDLCHALVNKEITVFVLTYCPLMSKASWKIYESSKYLKIFRIPWVPGLFYKLLKNKIIEFCYLVPGLLLFTPFILIFSRPNVIHAHGLVAGFVGVIWGRIFRIKIVISTHSLYHFPKSGLYRTFVKWIFSNADSILCLSNQSVEEIKKLGIQGTKIFRFTYWVDTRLFRPGSKKELKKKAGFKSLFNVLFVGRLVKEKGILEIIKSAELLNPEIQFIIIGEGPLKQEVIRSTKKYNNIKFQGQVDNFLLPTFYAAADLLVIPSIHEEGFGRVILESLSCGTPVIGANRGGIIEAMDVKVGCLIHITPINIASAINDLYKNQRTLFKLSKNARQLAKDRYGVENVNQIIARYIS